MLMKIDDAVSLSLGHSKAVALRAGGAMVFWNGVVGKEVTVPAPLRNLRAVEFAGDVVVGLRNDTGEVWVWDTTKPGVPRCFPTRGVKLAVTKGGFACVEEDGQIAVWGLRTSPAGAEVYKNRSLRVERSDDGLLRIGTSNVVDVAICADFGVAVLGDGRPVLNLEPIGRWARRGTKTHFRIEVGGAWPQSVQWRLAGKPIAGATNRIFSVWNIRPEDVRPYDVVVSNRYGTVVSRKAVLTVE